jgi:hypothetical protein
MAIPVAANGAVQVTCLAAVAAGFLLAVAHLAGGVAAVAAAVQARHVLVCLCSVLYRTVMLDRIWTRDF